MATYNHTTLLEFVTRLKKISGDLLGVFWTDAEWKLITQEALLTFGAISGFFKSDIQLHTEEDKRIYDLFVDTVIADKARIAPSLTYATILNWLNRDLIETISVATPTSELFALDDILQLIKKQYEIFQLETNLVLSQVSLNVAAANKTIHLPDDIIDIVAARFVSDDSASTVYRQDEQELLYFDASSLEESAAPQYYSVVYATENQLKLYPTPVVSGILELVVIKGQDTSVALTVDTVINLPNNLVPYLKYGVEIEIFNQDGLLNDPARVSYCQSRWQEGLQIGKLITSVLTAQGNGLYINTDSYLNVENFESELEQTDDPPSVLGFAGFNIFKIDTLPSNVVNSIVLSIISNALIPVNDGDFIEVEISYIKPLLNYCLHIAQMKCGAEYLAATSSYMQNFIRLAIGYNEKLQLKGLNYENLFTQTKMQEKSEPRLQTQ